MRSRISPTALFGELTRGPRIRAAVEPVFAQLLDEIRSGRFAAEWQEAASKGPGALEALRGQARDTALEETRRRLGLGEP